MEQRNLLLAIVFSVALLLGWQFLFLKPQVETRATGQKTAQTAPPSAGKAAPQPGKAQTGPPQTGIRGTAAPPSAGTATPPQPSATAGQPPAPGATPPRAPNRTEVLHASPRIDLHSPRLNGSIRVTGGAIDDLSLVDYRETTDPKSPEIVLLTPTGTENAYFADFGWVASANGGMPVPNESTRWKVTSDGPLTPTHPLTLRWDNGQGLAFERTVSVDKHYMFTVTQKVRNTGTKPVTLYPYGLISRTGTPHDHHSYLVYEGPLGVFDDRLKKVEYKDLKEDGKDVQSTTGGWIGITDKYWLVALVPDQKATVQTAFRHSMAGKADKYQADYLGMAHTVQPGSEATVTSRLFAGAKVVQLLNSYEDKLGISHFDLAVDWGWFYFLTKPIFYVLDFFAQFIGNFGLAILLLTVLIKGAFFPLANKSYKAMSRLKKLQPKIMEMRERYKGDKAKMNEAMMRLYREEHANPMSGCLPIIVQIPVFYSLYTVLYSTIEMRHAPFYGWIRDLSSPDPTTVFNLFGLIPWMPPHFLLIGAWPLIMGTTMWFQQRLNPTPADPTQAKIMMFLPVIFTFMLAQFPAGLVIYWAWNNTLSIAQQWFIMHRMGVKAS